MPCCKDLFLGVSKVEDDTAKCYFWLGKKLLMAISGKKTF